MSFRRQQRFQKPLRLLSLIHRIRCTHYAKKSQRTERRSETEKSTKDHHDGEPPSRLAAISAIIIISYSSASSISRCSRCTLISSTLAKIIGEIRFQIYASPSANVAERERGTDSISEGCSRVEETVGKCVDGFVETGKAFDISDESPR